jgi:hypothetical protein
MTPLELYVAYVALALCSNLTIWNQKLLNLFVCYALSSLLPLWLLPSSTVFIINFKMSIPGHIAILYYQSRKEQRENEKLRIR